MQIDGKAWSYVERNSIQNAVRVHFEDIGQSEEEHDVTYENAQARERTQILMDLANKTNGWSLEPGICQNLHLDGQLTVEITCLCMESMPLCRRHWYIIL